MFLLVCSLSRTVEDACPYVRYRNIVWVILFVFLGTSRRRPQQTSNNVRTNQRGNVLLPSFLRKKAVLTYFS